MTKQCPVQDDQSQLAQLVRDAEEGAAIELTRNGRPVAVLVSKSEFQRMQSRPATPPQQQPDKKENFWKLYQEFLKKYPIEEYGYDESDFENLRDPTPGREVPCRPSSPTP